MGRELFVDTSGFYALLVRSDPKHAAARRILRQARSERRRLLTTDYVLDETATLLKASAQAQLAQPLFERVFQSSACRIEWTDESQFIATRDFFLKHSDQAWSFTDCASFCLMRALKLPEALTTDVHFHQAGFVALLK